MPIDLKQFAKATFAPRTREIPVPGLADFTEDGKAVWTVRGLTAEELGRAQQAADNSGLIAAMGDALAAGQNKELTGALRELLGYGTKVPPDIAKRIEMLCIASVDPVPDRPTVVLLAERLPLAFYALTNAILDLTNQGSEATKKPGGSGKTPESGPRSRSAK